MRCSSYRGSNWEQVKARILARANGKCERCKKRRILTVHHKLPFRLFSNYKEANTFDNLQALCRECHTRTDNEIWKKYPLFFTNQRFPDCRTIRSCCKCGTDFVAKPHEYLCEVCTIHTCDWCKKEFHSRKRRNVRFCSKECNQQYRIANRKWPH